MPRSRGFVAGLLVWILVPRLQAQDPSASPQQPRPIVRDVRVVGAKELSPNEVEGAAHVLVGEPLPDALDRIGDSIERRYRHAGFTFAHANAAFDDATGTLTLTIDEGVIDRVEFSGVDESLARRFKRDFALRAGDVFNRDRANEALEALLRPTRGAVRPRRLYPSAPTGSEAAESHRSPFDIQEENGEHILRVALMEKAGRFRIVPDLGDREDWFTSVDGLVPSLGFGAAVFNHQDFNHTYLAGHLSFKTASSEVGYAIGFEQPFFTKTKLFVGVEVHDLTATEDGWRVSPLEASLAAIGPRLSNHDYYQRRGVQINAALRVHRRVEFQFAWRDERHEPLFVESDFSVWNDDEPFRPNLIAQPGLLRSLIVGASIDGEGFDRESLDASYRRHQLEAPFGALLNEQSSKSPEPVWRIDWTSEIASPDVLGGDFDFRRHIISARARLPLSPHQEFGVRGIGGWSQGTLPPQREFAIGGIGSVHGYGFKEAVGDQMVLANLEYWIGWRDGLRATAFFDAGHVSTKAANTDSPWLKGIGFGVGITDSFRVDFGYKVDEIPSSFQVLWRFSRTW